MDFEEGMTGTKIRDATLSVDFENGGDDDGATTPTPAKSIEFADQSFSATMRTSSVKFEHESEFDNEIDFSASDSQFRETTSATNDLSKTSSVSFEPHQGPML